MSTDTQQFASPYDQSVASSFATINKVLGLPIGPTEEEKKRRERYLLGLYRRHARWQTVRARDQLEQQAFVETNFSNPALGAGHWRRAAWLDPSYRDQQQPAPIDPAAMRLQHKDGAKFEVTPGSVNFSDTSKANFALINHGMQHVAKNWQGDGLAVEGNDRFKAATWAFAQLYGVKVTNYSPQGESLALAKQIIATQQDGVKLDKAPTVAPKAAETDAELLGKIERDIREHRRAHGPSAPPAGSTPA